MSTLVQINTTLNYGSTGRIAEGTGLLARQKGWNCYMAHGPRMKNGSRLRTIQVNSSLDEKIHGGWYSLLRDRRETVRRLCFDEIDREWTSAFQMNVLKNNLHSH